MLNSYILVLTIFFNRTSGSRSVSLIAIIDDNNDCHTRLVYVKWTQLMFKEWGNVIHYPREITIENLVEEKTQALP